MSRLNLNNFGLLAKFGRSSESVSIQLGKKELFRIEKGAVNALSADEIKKVFDEILFDSHDVVILSNDAVQVLDEVQNCDGMNISFLLTEHITSMEPSGFSSVIQEPLRLKFATKLGFNEYAHYLKHTDVFISPILYQWLSTRFESDPEAPVQCTEVRSALGHLAEDPYLLTQTVFALASLGCMDVTYSAQSATAPTALPQRAPLASSYTPGSKLGLAKFICQALEGSSRVLTIGSDEENYLLDLSEIVSSSDKLGELKANNFLLGSLVTRNYKESVMSENMEPQLVDSARFRLFSQVKKLPLQLFSDNFIKNRERLFTLTELNYIVKAAHYRSAGMDITDFSILSMLRIRSSAIDTLEKRLCNYRPEEINRSLFGLVMLGLVETSEKVEPARIPASQVPIHRDPELEQHKDILMRIAKKLVTM